MIYLEAASGISHYWTKIRSFDSRAEAVPLIEDHMIAREVPVVVRAVVIARLNDGQLPLEWEGTMLSIDYNSPRQKRRYRLVEEA